MYEDHTIPLTPGGALTIPADVLARAGLARETEVQLVIDGSTVRVRRKEPQRTLQPIEDWIERARGLATTGLTTEEIMAMTRGED